MRRIEKCYKSMNHTLSGLEKVYKTRLEQVEEEYES